MGVMRNVTIGNHLQSWPKRLVNELCGLALMLLALFTAVALLSFHESDPSLNMAADHSVLNIGGIAGAYMANPLLQTLGLASMLVVVMMMAWGWRLISSKRVPSFIGIRIVMFLCSLVLLSSVFAVIDAPMFWPIENGLGGAIGTLVRRDLRHFPMYAPLAFALLFVTVPLALGLTLGEWKAILRMSWKSVMFALRIISIFRPAKMEDMAYAEDAKPSKLARLSQKMKLRAVEEDEEDGEEEKQPRKPLKKDLIAAPRLKAQPKLAQSSLELRPRRGEYQLPPLSLLAEAGKKAKKTDIQ